MASAPGSIGNITGPIPNPQTSPENSNVSGNSRKLLSRVSDSAEQSKQLDDAKAREAANKFEALLIHNMLKSMRKTTMTENKSNDRAIYDDMLDEKLADTMMKAGGLGIADQIVDQIREQQGKKTPSSSITTDRQRLRELSKQMQRTDLDNVLSSTNPSSYRSEAYSTSIGNLRMAKALWSNERSSELTREQQDFVKPLLPHAQRNASKLGTSANAILAIAALETGWGQSMIKDRQGKDSHNLFGIKASEYDNRYATTLTTEYIQGSPQKMNAKFKTYENPADSVDGFAQFILSNPRYSNALKHASNPELFLQELQSAGYATDPRYADKAISIMRQIAGN